MTKVPFGKIEINLPEGFHLKKEDDHFVHLYYQEGKVATFNATSVHPLSIQQAAEEFLAKKKEVDRVTGEDK